MELDLSKYAEEKEKEYIQKRERALKRMKEEDKVVYYYNKGYSIYEISKEIDGTEALVFKIIRKCKENGRITEREKVYIGKDIVDNKEDIIELYNKGVSIKRIGSILNIADSQIKKGIKIFKERGYIEEKSIFKRQAEYKGEEYKRKDNSKERVKENEQEIIKDILDGVLSKDIEKKYNISSMYITEKRKELKDLGYDLSKRDKYKNIDIKAEKKERKIKRNEKDIIELYKKGEPYTYIKTYVGVTYKDINRVIQGELKEGRLEDIHKIREEVYREIIYLYDKEKYSVRDIATKYNYKYIYVDGVIEEWKGYEEIKNK